MDYGNTAPRDADMSPAADPRDVVREMYPFDTPQPQLVPVTQESPIMSFDPEDATTVSRFFQNIADKVVLASSLTKQVEQLAATVKQLQNDVEIYRENNARLDEEVNRLRMDRVALQDENAQLHQRVEDEVKAHAATTHDRDAAYQEREHWHSSYISLSTTHQDTRRERDDAQMKTMELEERIKVLEAERDNYRDAADNANSRLNSVESALRGQPRLVA